MAFEHGNIRVSYTKDGKTIIVEKKDTGEHLDLSGHETADLFKCIGELSEEATRKAVQTGALNLEMVVGKKVLDPTLVSSGVEDPWDPQYVIDQLDSLVSGDNQHTLDMFARMRNMIRLRKRGDMMVSKVGCYFSPKHKHPCFVWFNYSTDEINVETVIGHNWQRVQDHTARLDSIEVADDAAFYRGYLVPMMQLLEQYLFENPNLGRRHIDGSRKG